MKNRLLAKYTQLLVITPARPSDTGRFKSHDRATKLFMAHYLASASAVNHAEKFACKQHSHGEPMRSKPVGFMHCAITKSNSTDPALVKLSLRFPCDLFRVVRKVGNAQVAPSDDPIACSNTMLPNMTRLAVPKLAN